MSLLRVSKNTSVTPKVPKTSVETQYPYTWFPTNKSKPILNIDLTTSNLNAAAGVLKKQILDNNIDIEVAKTFLLLFASNIKAKLEEDWTSYTIQIGTKDEEITPLSLLKINQRMAFKEGTQIAVNEEDMPWLAAYALSIYRLIRATISEYKTQIASRITTQLQTLNKNSTAMTDVVDIYIGWSGDKVYNTLVAVYDMFFHKFPNHKYANMRIGTTGSRFRDCAALLSYGYLMDLLGLSKTTDVMDWVFIEQVGDNIDRMMNTEDEILDVYSYFPYHVDLGLVTKSSYSASANPCFFEWVHIVGSFLQSQRSLNARHITDSQSLQIMANAACMAYAFSNSFEFQKVYAESIENANATHDSDDDDDILDESEKIMGGRDAGAWCLMLKTNGGKLPKKVKLFIRKSINLIKEPRLGTVEEYLENTAKILLEQ